MGAREKYDELDNLYSNNYRFSLFTQRTGLLYNYTGKKTQSKFLDNWGSRVSNSVTSTTTRYSSGIIVNWYPQARVSTTGSARAVVCG